MISRVRSSSRCSTRLSRSSCAIGRSADAQRLLSRSGRSSALAARRVRRGLLAGDRRRLLGWLLRRGAAAAPACGLFPDAWAAASSLDWIASSSLSLPVIESLNSRIPEPSWLPRPGSRLGPKISSTITRTMMSSRGPIEGITGSVAAPVAILERVPTSWVGSPSAPFGVHQYSRGRITAPMPSSDAASVPTPDATEPRHPGQAGPAAVRPRDRGRVLRRPRDRARSPARGHGAGCLARRGRTGPARLRRAATAPLVYPVEWEEACRALGGDAALPELRVDAARSSSRTRSSTASTRSSTAAPRSSHATSSASSQANMEDEAARLARLSTRAPAARRLLGRLGH